MKRNSGPFQGKKSDSGKPFKKDANRPAFDKKDKPYKERKADDNRRPGEDRKERPAFRRNEEGSDRRARPDAERKERPAFRRNEEGNDRRARPDAARKDSADKPYGDRKNTRPAPRSDSDSQSNGDKPEFEKRADRPYRKSSDAGTGRRFDKPADRKSGRPDSRNNNEEGRDRNSDRPERKDTRPFRERNNDKPARRFDKPAGDRPAFRKNDRDNDATGRDNERPTYSRDNKKEGSRPYGDKRKPFNKKEEGADKGGHDIFKKLDVFEQKKVRKDENGNPIPTPERRKDREEIIEEKPKTAFKTPHKFKRQPEEEKPKKDIAPVGKSGRKRKRFDEDDEDEATEDTAAMPLNKYIAHSGECSRRDAADLVKQGKVKVNGELVTDPGYKMQEDDKVTLLGKKLAPQKNRAYVLLNKPKGFITTTEDPQERKTVMDLVANSGVDRLYPVGRLDRNTTGLLLLTNDGDLAQKLSHPSYEIRKVYQVTLDKALTKADFEKIVNGLELEDGKVQVDDLAYLESKSELGIEIHSGRNRIVRRIFESLGYEVEKLDRVTYAGLTKKNLPRSKWRFLTEQEIIHLKHFKN